MIIVGIDMAKSRQHKVVNFLKIMTELSEVVNDKS